MKLNESNIKKAKKYLDKNYCIGVPTETVYGIAANAYSNYAVQKIYKLKKRPKSNPLIVHYFSINDLAKDCQINDSFLKLYKKFSPGPLTYVLNLIKNSKISKKVTNKENNLAVRFPRHATFRKLLSKLDYPLAAPSANITTKLSAVRAADIKEDFGNKIKYILDGGKCNIGVESTIIDLRKNPTILRLGGLEVSKIEKVLNTKIKIQINSKKIKSPGQSRLHYSPGIPLRMNALRPKKNEAFILLKKKKKNNSNYFYLSKKNNLKEAAKNLYTSLRKIKNSGYKSIAVEKIKNFGIGQTINDRLRRASKF
jgi:L-threonylcarbamoyladenylate synthase